jgi:hypothetical protein
MFDFVGFKGHAFVLMGFGVVERGLCGNGKDVGFL